MFNSREKRLVIIDDDDVLVQLLKDKFELQGYHVSTFFNASSLFRHISKYGLPHLALVDIHLPETHGFELSKELKAYGDVPIVFISNVDQQKTINDGLMKYADDYVRKPFDICELEARVNRILSRIYDTDFAQPPIMIIDERLSIDFGNKRLQVDSRSVTLTPIEAQILHILLRNAGNIIPANVLLARVWPYDEIYEETLRVHIHRLRRKVELDYHHPQYIQTIYGIGYKFVLQAHDLVV